MASPGEQGRASATAGECRVKLCGLRTAADVRAAASLDVDAVGFVLSESPRRVSSVTCRELRALVPAGVRAHGVFGPEEPEFVRRMVLECGLDLAQVHGREDDAGYWRKMRAVLAGIPLLRAFRLRRERDLRLLASVRGEAFLVDAFAPYKVGGTGGTCDWELARRARAYGRLVLAGGLDPDNVRAAITRVRPWMVDVSSGIESAPGIKDAARMRAFVLAVRRARSAGAAAAPERGAEP